MKTKLVILSAFLIAILSSTGVAYASTTSNLATNSNQWAVYEEATLPNGGLNFYPGAHGTTFAVPDATGATPTYVNYMLDTYTASLTEASVITATFTITTSLPSTVFAYNPDGIICSPNVTSNTCPGAVRLFIQANLPNDNSATCTGGGNALNYWWSDTQFYSFSKGAGTVTLTTSLDASAWSGICGGAAGSNQAGFDLALANIKLVGLSFGSGDFFANGLGVDGSTGTAQFQLTSYTVTP